MSGPFDHQHHPPDPSTPRAPPPDRGHAPNARLADTVAIPGHSGFDRTLDLHSFQPPPSETSIQIDPDASSCRYRLGPEIGRGGVGVIHEAWDTLLDREVALKILADELKRNPTVVRRFLEEARITGRLQHPGVVPIHELGMLADGRPYFAMRRVRGDTLQQRLTQRSTPDDDLGALLSVFGKVCEAVAYAHALGIIHRDLKPSNVMVGTFGVTHVMDWGLAKSLARSHAPMTELPPERSSFQLDHHPISRLDDSALQETQFGSVFGTPAYLAPEQARGAIDLVDTRADVFGLGAILCEILTGTPPYSGDTLAELLHHAIHGNVARARARLQNSRAAPELIHLADACLSPEPSERPSSAIDVADSITHYLQSEQRRAERDLVHFFDLSLDLFGILSLGGRFQRVNANFLHVLGLDAAELTSRPFVDFVHPEDRDATRRVYDQLCQGTACLQFLNRYRHASGHYLWFEWNAILAPAERLIYAVARDVTERVAIIDARLHSERDRLHFEAAVDSVDIATFSTTPDGIVVCWNRGAERLFGLDAANIIGHHLDTLAIPGQEHDLRKLLARLAHSSRVDQHDFPLRRISGRVIDVSLTASPFRDETGRVAGISLIARESGLRKSPE